MYFHQARSTLHRVHWTPLWCSFSQSTIQTGKMTKFSKSQGQGSTQNNKKGTYKSKKPEKDEFADILSAIGQLNEKEKAGESGSNKLTKQERRNLNKKNKSLNIQVSQPTKAAPTESVYKRETVYPPAVADYSGPWDRFLRPEDEEYQSVVDQSYKGLHVCLPSQSDSKFRSEFDTALEGLDVEGFYQYDVTQPQGLGTKTAKTFVTRCLVGDAGTTYKYLGIRMFSIPWNLGPKEDASLTSKHALTVGRLNQRLIERTTKLLSKEGKSKAGSCQYNLTLINRCFPEDQCILKNEPGFEKDKCTVSWHADSTLDHFSSIGVYHCTSPLPCTATTSAAPCNTAPSKGCRGAKGSKNKLTSALGKRDAPEEDVSNEETGTEEGAVEEIDVVAEKKGESEKVEAPAAPKSDEPDLSWRLALRVWYDAEGPNATKAITSRAGEMQTAAGSKIAPALAVPLPSGACYFLLDDFNHHHQHSVLAGNTYRYASTHRVCKTEGHTFQSVVAKTNRLLQVTGKQQFLGKNIRLEQLMMNEIEFEWLRQFYIQGEKHRQLHVWWHQPMQEYLRLWGELENRTISTLEVLKTAATFNFQKKFDQTESGAEVSAEARAERKKWVKTLQRLECVDAASFAAMAEALKDRHEKRVGWAAREKDGIFSSLPKDCAPLPCPLEERLLQQNNKPEAALASLPRVTSLLNMVQCVEQWQKAFEVNKKSTGAGAAAAAAVGKNEK